MRTELNEGEELYVALGDSKEFAVTVECNYLCFRRLCRMLLPMFNGNFDDAAEAASGIVFSVLCPSMREAGGVESFDVVMRQLKAVGFDFSKHALMDKHAELFVDPFKVCLALCKFPAGEPDSRLFRRMH